MRKITKWFLFIIISVGCNGTSDTNFFDKNKSESDIKGTLPPTISYDTSHISSDGNSNRDFLEVSGSDLVDFAKTLIGTPYKYASTNPLQGFDCSGYITYVFNHFKIKVPRSSIDFTNFGKEIEVRNAKIGDLILFTGTVDTDRIVGHIGIITENVDTLKFIHSTSGKAYGVTISDLSNYYKRRFVKVIRVLDEQ